MTAEAQGRQTRRAIGQARLDALAEAFAGRPDVDRAAMFGSAGLRHRGRFFAFVGRDGQLVLKLPHAQAAALVARGEAESVRAGRSVTREWVGVGLPEAGGDAERWRSLLEAAYRYAAGGVPDPDSTEEPG